MEAKSSEAFVPSEALKYRTWFLKVSINCEGCRRKVKKVLQSIDGVFTTTVDLQQQKVTVTGSIGVETLIWKLVKAGKHAEIWPENLAAGKGKNSGKDKQQQQKKKKKKEDGEEGNAESKYSKRNAEEKSNSGRKKGIENGEKRNGEKKGGKSEGSCEKKKKKKDESRLEVQINLSPTRQQSYYVSALPYMCSGLDPYYRLQSPPFQIFSDDNANACSIM